MSTGHFYTITLGKYSDKYMCRSENITGYELLRVRKPKTKIDAVRLPEVIIINHFASPAIDKK